MTAVEFEPWSSLLIAVVKQAHRDARNRSTPLYAKVDAAYFLDWCRTEFIGE